MAEISVVHNACVGSGGCWVFVSGDRCFMKTLYKLFERKVKAESNASRTT
jgi:hypothetical protein